MSERDDWESRLRDTLTERAQDAPVSHGLADGARRRLRRRRTTGAVLAVAAVAAVVPLGMTWLSGSDDGAAPVVDEPTTTATASSPASGVIETGYRAESWHDVTFEVPVEWGYGGTTAWCAGADSPEAALPVVARPDTVTLSIACNPTEGYGVTVGPADFYEAGSGDVFQYSAAGNDQPRYPDGTWVSVWYDEEVAVTVATPDRALTDRIVGSVQTVDGVDPNECPPSSDGVEDLRDSTSDSLSICRYDEDGALTASRRLIGEESQDAQTTIMSAPRRVRDIDCPDEGPTPVTVLLQGGGYVGRILTEATCEGANGIFVGGEDMELDEAALRVVDLTRLP